MTWQVALFLIAGYGSALEIQDPQKGNYPPNQSRLRMFDQWLRYLSPVISMWPKPQWPGICVADAFAANDRAGIGGAVHFPSGQYKWFSLPLCRQDFLDLEIPIHDNLQKDISSLETLAQIALIFVATRFQPGFHSKQASNFVR